ncbi:MAG TPA: hypothetical protein PLO41_20275 [Rubrivivax sp.]|nr:hypothetical protein [Rubrivivax sp.]
MKNRPRDVAVSFHPHGRWMVLTALAAAVAAAVSGCGSDGDGGSTTPTPTPTTIAGTVAVGAAVPGATITIKDADAATADLTASAGANGEYSIDVSALKAPLLLSASGTLNGEPVSVVAVVPTLAGNDANTANVTSLTNAVAALIAPGGDLNALATPTAIAAVNAQTVVDASTLVVNTLKSNPAFADLLGANFDPLKTAFTANGSGIDSVLDQVQVQVGSSGVSIANLTAPVSDSGAPPEPVQLTQAQVATPTQAPSLPASEPASNLPSVADMTAIAKKFESCLALPLEQRVTMDANKEVTAVPAAACNFGVGDWKSDGGGWVERMGMNTFRYAANTGMRVGQPTVATVLAPPNDSGTTFQHPYCNTQTCVIMYVPMTTASGKASGGFFTLAKVNGAWAFVGNQLPYAMGVEQRLNRLVAVNTALAEANPSDYFLQDRIESTIRLTFNPDASMTDTANVRAVVWKGPGLPAAGVVTHRSQRCGTDDRFPITNQDGVLTVNNSSSIQWWNNGGGTDFKIDAAKVDGTALTMAAPTSNWAGTASPLNQDYRATPFTGTIPAWSMYTAEIYYFSNTGTTPDEVIKVRNSTAYERASAGAAKNWPALAQTTIDAYLKPTGTHAGSLTTLAHTIDWSNPSDGYVNFGYLVSQNRITATNSQNETSSTYWKRGNMLFRIGAAGDTTALGYEWAPNRSGVGLSAVTPAGSSSTVANSGNSPNPRCTGDEVLPLDGHASRSSYRELGLQVRDSNRKLSQLIHFWRN